MRAGTLRAESLRFEAIEMPATGYARRSDQILVIPGIQAQARPARRRTGWSLRARLVVLLMVTGLLLGINALLGGMPADAANAGSMGQPGPGEVVIIVQPGDSLWSLAQAAAPDVDPRAAILQIRQANGLTDSGVMAGQRLVIPAIS